MPHYTYLIVGGGMTADAAVRGLRKLDKEGSVGIVGAEPHPPYNRPLLSKGLWQDKSMSIWRGTEKRDVALHLGRTAMSLDPNAKRVQDDQGQVYTFEKLLLATGVRPRRLPSDSEPVIYFRTLDDYERLRARLDWGSRVAVIGGGYIGWELAAALATNGAEVTMLFPDVGIGAQRFPPDLVAFLNHYYQEKGVAVVPGEVVTGVKMQGGEVIVKTRRGLELRVDAVVAGLGTEPNVELARAAGLEVDNGIVTDGFLRTSHPDVFAAGDVANVYSPVLGRRMRAEHEDNANSTGWFAGQAMVGRSAPYDHLPSFYSDLFDLGFEAVGTLDSRLETVSHWKEPFREGTVYYLDQGQVRGVLLWNVWGQLEAARQLMVESRPFEAQELIGHMAG